MTSYTLLAGDANDKLWKLTGQFSSVVAASISTSAVDASETATFAICFSGSDNSDTTIAGNTNDRLTRISGQFSSTVLATVNVNTTFGEATPTGVSWDGTNTLFCGQGQDRMYLVSGAFSTTLLASLSFPTATQGIQGVSWDGTNTIFTSSPGTPQGKNYAVAGKFSSTILTSITLSYGGGGSLGKGTDIAARRRGTIIDTMWCVGGAGQKIMLTSGQFSSTVISSLSTTTLTPSETVPRGIDATNRFPVTASVTCVGKGKVANVGYYGWLRMTGRASVTISELVFSDNVIWAGATNGKLHKMQGQFSSTELTSISLSSILSGSLVSDCSVHSTGDACFSHSGSKLYRLSGQFSTTVHSSLNILSSPGWPATGLVFDGSNTLICGDLHNLYKLSGCFSSTILTSIALAVPWRGITYDGINTLLARGGASDQLWLLSGFTSTIITSAFSIFTVDSEPNGVSFNGRLGKTLIAGDGGNKLYRLISQITTTVDTSITISTDGTLVGIDCTDINTRLYLAQFASSATCIGKGKLRVNPNVGLTRLTGLGRLRVNPGVGLTRMAGRGVVVISSVTNVGVITMIGKGKVTVFGSTVGGLKIGQATCIGKGKLNATVTLLVTSPGSLRITGLGMMAIEPLVIRKAVLTSSFDWTDQTKVKLWVNSVAVTLGNSQNFVQLDSYRISYSEKVLEFSEIPNSTYANAAYDMDTPVQLQMDLTSSGSLTTYFRGHIRAKTLVGNYQAESIRYTAVGLQKTYGDAGYYTVATTATSELYRLNPSVVELYNLSNADYVRTARLATTTVFSLFPNSIAVGQPGTTQNAYGYFPSGFSVQGTVISIGQQFAGFANAKFFWDDELNTWNVFSPPSGKVIDISINSFEVAEHSIQVDTTNRFSAVALTEQVSVENHSLPNYVGFFNLDTYADGWSSKTDHNLFASDPTTKKALRNFRANFPHAVDCQLGDYQLQVLAPVRLEAGPTHANLIPVSAEFDFAITSADPQALGYPDYIKNTTSYATYFTLNQATLSTVATTVTVINFPVFRTSTVYFTLAQEVIYKGDASALAESIAIDLDTNGHTPLKLSAMVAQYAFPPRITFATGATTPYGLLKMLVPFGEASVAKAMKVLSLYKDPLVRGSLPIQGPPLHDMMFLKTRVKLSAATMTVPTSLYNGIVSQYTYEFGKVGLSTIEMSSDLSEYISI